jgi:hypothetical protein
LCVIWWPDFSIFIECLFAGFRVSSRVRMCGGRLRRFGDLRKNTALEFRSMHLMCFVDLLCCLSNFRYLVGSFRVSQQGASVAAASLVRRPQKKHAPGILEHVPFVFSCFFMNFSKFYVFFSRFQGPPSGCVRCRCLWRFADLRKTPPWILGACIFCIFRISATSPLHLA